MEYQHSYLYSASDSYLSVQVEKRQLLFVMYSFVSFSRTEGTHGTSTVRLLSLHNVRCAAAIFVRGVRGHTGTVPAGNMPRLCRALSLSLNLLSSSNSRQVTTLLCVLSIFNPRCVMKPHRVCKALLSLKYVFFVCCSKYLCCVLFVEGHFCHS